MRPVPDRRLERLRLLRARLRAEGLDALLVSHPPNVRYLTGFTGTTALVVVSAEEMLFLSDFRYQTQAAEEVGALARIVIDTASLWERLFKLLPELGGVGCIGFEAHVLAVRDAERLANGDRPWRFRPTADLVEAQRLVKAPEEIAAIRRAAAVTTAALRQTIGAVRAGMTETEVAALLEAALRRGGSEGYPFPTIAASGARAALPHARTSAKVVGPGDLLLLDFGAVVDGYCADVSRTFVVGAEPDGRQREVYEVVRRAQEAALGGLAAGATGRAADALARDVIEAAGFGPCFGHSLGHGLGLEVHEAPRLARTAEQVLAEGAVVTVEPGVYLPGWGGVRIEDDVVVRPGGVEVLTEFPRELMRLG